MNLADWAVVAIIVTMLVLTVSLCVLSVKLRKSGVFTKTDVCTGCVDEFHCEWFCGGDCYTAAEFEVGGYEFRTEDTERN